MPDPGGEPGGPNAQPPMHNMRSELKDPNPSGDAGALDLGATVLPVLAKNYWRHALALVLVLLVIRRLLRRS